MATAARPRSRQASVLDGVATYGSEDKFERSVAKSKKQLALLSLRPGKTLSQDSGW